MYSTQRHKGQISVRDYVKDYVDTEKFIVYCKACPNYGKKWSCPEYSFDPCEIWAQYKTLKLTALKIVFDEKTLTEPRTKEEKGAFLSSCLVSERKKLDSELLRLEKTENATALYAGSCILCGKTDCTRLIGEECRNIDSMRYSLESLGGDVAKTSAELLGVPLKWGSENALPEYLTLVCGLLVK